MKLAIIHTTPVTVEPLKALAAELMPGVRVSTFVDDTILPQLGENGGDLRAVEPRLTCYARFAEETGADIILSACSSVGELARTMREAVTIPVVRIDEAMAEEAVRSAQHIGVAATMPTTLAPTMRLLREKAEAAGREVRLESVCVQAAFERLAAGDQEGHDALLAQALTELAGRTERVVLAQASMARVVPALPAELQGKFLTSPRLGMERVKAVLEGSEA